MRKQRRGLSAFRLKIIAGIFLSLSVASSTVIPALLGDPHENFTALTVVVICEVVSWSALPIYAWLLVSGFHHTRSVAGYGARLAALALGSEIPYDLATYGTFSFAGQNPVWGLLLALIVLVLVQEIRTRYSGVAGAALIFAVTLLGVLWAFMCRIGLRQEIMNIGALIIIFSLIFYLLELRENTMMVTAGLIGSLCLVTPAIGVAFLHYRNETLGYRQASTQWFFYYVYPVMLLAGVGITFL